jgi:hypothetical protein
MQGLSKAVFTMGRFKGALCTSVQEDEFVFKVVSTGELNRYKDGDFSLTVFHNGEQKDLSFNGWMFSSVVNGRYHEPGSYESVFVNVECKDAGGHCLKEGISIDGTSNYLIQGGALYMNLVAQISLFKDKSEYESVGFTELRRSYRACGFDDRVLESTIEKLRILKGVIKRSEENDSIPSAFIAVVRNDYDTIVRYIKENVELERLFDVFFE